MEIKDFDYAKVKDEYKADDFKDDERVYRIKTALERLTPVERKIFIAYIELGTFAGVAKLYNVTPPTAKTYIISIIKKIKNLCL